GPAGPASSGSPTPCPSPTPTSGAASFLKEFPLTDWGELTAFESEGKYATATLLSSQSVIELHPQIARAVIDSRFKIIGADNEGFESEIYFARKERFYGAFRLRNGPCEGQVTVRLLFLLKPGGSSI
ncbi:MAG: hypothetical protein QOK47_658, partial [Actinomycetota bacterium]|nr:hypothetical protein [Actinomycetota bacterium]